MALIHGAKGIIYFAHQFKPKFIEAGLLADEEMAREVAALNRQIRELAPVLNGPDVADGASVASSEEGVPIDFVVKRHAGSTYLFAVAMREGETTATFTLPGTGDARVEVLGEGRTIEAVGGKWEDRFDGLSGPPLPDRPESIGAPPSRLWTEPANPIARRRHIRLETSTCDPRWR